MFGLRLRNLELLRLNLLFQVGNLIVQLSNLLLLLSQLLRVIFSQLRLLGQVELLQTIFLIFQLSQASSFVVQLNLQELFLRLLIAAEILDVIHLVAACLQ